MKNLKIKLILLCLVVVTSMNAQKTLSKISKSINVNKDVTIDLSTSYVQIEIDTWNKNVLEIEAYIDGEKLSQDELQEALKNWNLEVKGSGDYVSITSKGLRTVYGSWNTDRSYVNDYGDVLRDLELKLADLPEMPDFPNMPEVLVLPNFPNMPALPELPDFPELPELPELPEGVTSVHFDYDAYKKDGEKYLEKWSKDYEKKYGKAYKEDMKEWGRKFGESEYQEKLKAWGKNYSNQFDGKWSKEMEVWGKQFGDQFNEEWAEKLEKWGEQFGKEWEVKMEKWQKRHGKELEELSKALEHRSEALSKRQEELIIRLYERSNQRGSTGNRSKVKKVIKIKMPKKAKLKLNVRHGELKFSSVIHNLDAEISHSTLVANSIDGSETSISASYSSILVKNWLDGELDLNYDQDVILEEVNALILNSNSSNISINNLNNNAIINGSFGDLLIKNISSSFSNLNIILENSDAFVTLPKTDYNLVFKGNHSRFNNESTNSKTIKNYPTGNNSSKTIVVNAKYSNVVME